MTNIDGRQYELSGIDCANCARDIEETLRVRPGQGDSRVNFAAGTISFDPRYENDVRRTLHSMEPRARITPIAETEKRTALKEPLFPTRILLSAGLFAAGLILNGAGIRIALMERGLFLTAYVLAGYPVVFGAVRNLVRGKVIDELFLMTIASVGALVIGEAAEAVGVMLFYAVGESLQTRAVTGDVGVALLAVFNALRVLRR